MPSYLVHFNRLHDKKGRFTYGDGETIGRLEKVTAHMILPIAEDVTMKEAAEVVLVVEELHLANSRRVK